MHSKTCFYYYIGEAMQVLRQLENSYIIKDRTVDNLLMALADLKIIICRN